MKQKTGIFYSVAAASLFGIMPLFAKYIYSNGGNALTLCVHRFFFSIPALFLMVKLHPGESLALRKGEFKKIFIASQGSIATTLLLFTSYNYISSGTATTLHFIYPALVVTGCALLFRETVNRIQALCCVLCMAGILCFYTPGHSNGYGIFLALLSGVTNAFYIIYYSKSGISRISVYKMLFYLSIVNCLELAVISLFTGRLTFSLTGGGWTASVMTGVLFSFLANVMFQTGIKITGPQKASILSTFEPLTSLVAGVAFFQERIGIKSAAGILSILLSVIFLTVCDRQSQLQSE